MTRQALASDRGLQPERTVLAWTRTSHAVVIAGGLLLAKNPDPARLVEDPSRLAVGGLAVVVAAAVFLIGAGRRRTLGKRPLANGLTARREVVAAGTAVLTLGALVLAYLMLPLL
ncbi:DUF202 domain-containing protein [Mycolicibacterium vaccae]|uniref:DUF202 domain-containing protein n=1 Tax=Mycolicibacterium vaccae TaxID=1810 RepID=UPI003CFE2081